MGKVGRQKPQINLTWISLDQITLCRLFCYSKTWFKKLACGFLIGKLVHLRLSGGEAGTSDCTGNNKAVQRCVISTERKVSLSTAETLCLYYFYLLQYYYSMYFFIYRETQILYVLLNHLFLYILSCLCKPLCD